MRSRSLLLLCIVTACAGRPEARSWQSRTVEEYGLRLAFPRYARICPALSWENLNGWSMRLEGGCGDSEGRRIVVGGHYNAMYHASPEQVAGCDAGSRAAQGAAGLAFPGRRSAACLADERNGVLIVTVATQAHDWPGRRPDDGPEQLLPWVNYTASLVTTRATLARDLALLRQVIERVRIGEPGR